MATSTRWPPPDAIDTSPPKAAITLSVFVPFSIFYMKEKLSFDFVWAALCMVGAAYFVFRGR